MTDPSGIRTRDEWTRALQALFDRSGLIPKQAVLITRRTVTFTRPADAVARKPVDDWRDRLDERRRFHEDWMREKVMEAPYWRMIKDAFRRHHPGWERGQDDHFGRFGPYWSYRYGTFNGGRPEDQWAEPDKVLLDKVLGIYMDEIRAEDARREAERERQAAAEEAARKAGAAAARVKAEEALTAKMIAVETARAKTTEALTAKMNA
jgi:hypothetical protein